jgi:hypothetical protein
MRARALRAKVFLGGINRQNKALRSPSPNHHSLAGPSGDINDILRNPREKKSAKAHVQIRLESNGPIVRLQVAL